MLNMVDAMPTLVQDKYPRIAARIPQALKARLDRADANTNQGESAITRTALEEFFLKYKTDAQVFQAVLASVRRAAE